MKFRFIFIILLAFTLSACSLAEDITPPANYQPPTVAPTAGPLFPANPPDLAAGAAIFAEKCAPCHGAQGLGDGPSAASLPKKPAALGSAEFARAAVPAAWYTTVTQGKIDAFMPPFASLSDQDRWNVVAYALSLSVAPEQLAQGKTVYEANCADCHGADGAKSEKSNFSDQALMSTLSGNDLVKVINQGVDKMPAYESKLSETDRYAVAAYVRAFAFVAAPKTPLETSTPLQGASPEPATPTEGTPSAETGTPAPTQSASVTGTPGEIVGTIGGKISNGSGGPLPGGLKAVLHVFEHDAANSQFNEISTQEAPLSTDGAYSFADVSMPASQAFYITVDYAGTTYQSEPLVQKAGQTAYDLPISIYDTSTDASVLEADQAHILLDYSKPGIIQVVEFYIISNPGTKTIIPSGKSKPIVTVSLPKGYTNLQFQDGQLGTRYLQTANGFGDTAPVIPGKQQYQLVFAFDLPYSNNFEFRQPFSLNVSAVTLLVSEGAKAEGQNLVDGGLKDMGNGGGKYQLYSAGSFKPDQALTATVSGAPAQATSATPVAGIDSTQVLIIAVAVLGLVLILAGIWLFWRSRKRTSGENKLPDEADAELMENTDEILDAIIALDDQRNAGNIADEAYQQRRAGLKQKLKGKL